MRRNKYNAIKTTVNGIVFASKREAARYQMLLLELKAGKITDLELQCKYELQPAFDKNDVHYRAIVYKADFTYKQSGKVVVEDVKGFKKDKVFLLKQKMFEYVYRDLELKIT